MKQFGNIPNLGGPTKIWIFDVFKPAFYDIEDPNLGGPTKIWEFGKLFHLFSNCLQLFSNCFNCFEIVSSCFQIVYYVPAHCFRPNTEHEGGCGGMWDGWGEVGWGGGGGGGGGGGLLTIRPQARDVRQAMSLAHALSSSSLSSSSPPSSCCQCMPAATSCLIFFCPYRSYLYFIYSPPWRPLSL